MGQDQMIPFASTRNDKSVMQPFAILIWTLSTHTHTHTEPMFIKHHLPQQCV